MEEPKPTKAPAPAPAPAPQHRLLRATAKVQLANRMLRGKCLRKAPPGRPGAGCGAAAGRQPPLRKRATGRKPHGRRAATGTAAPGAEPGGWTIDGDTKAVHLLLLLCLVVGVQVYNAYENLDDHLLLYDVEQLEKTVHRELLGQTLALNKLTKLLRDYLGTYVHDKPLFLSINGPAGVGKSYLGRLIAKHFRFQLGPQMVLQHSVRYQRLAGRAGWQPELAARVSAVFSEARRAHRIPVLLFDEMELAPPELLSFVGRLLRTEHPSAVYIFVSKVGHDRIVRAARRGAPARLATRRVAQLSQELAQQFRRRRRHPVWRAPEIIPLCPLERAHVLQCFHQLMRWEGLQPSRRQLEAMANAVSYYRARHKLFAQQGCKRVPSVVRKFSQQKRMRHQAAAAAAAAGPGPEDRGTCAGQLVSMLDRSFIHS